ncbi:hypothetical protein A2U01_0103177, partial [Trifolium medium]|nr:hypothetical protein [Trifolium medium]
SIVDAVIAEKQQDGAVAVHTANVLLDAMIPTTHKLAQHNVMLNIDSG